MKKVLLASVISSSIAVTAQAESPVRAGEFGLVINPVGEESVGLRVAMTDTLVAYGLVRYFDLLTDEVEVYSTTSESYETYATDTNPDLSVAGGLQYFISGGLYLLGEVGYYTSEDNYDFESGAKNEGTFKGLDWSVGVGFEHKITERLSLHSSAELEVGGRDIVDSEYDDSGDQVDGAQFDRSYTEVQYRLGFSYALN